MTSNHRAFDIRPGALDVAFQERSLSWSFRPISEFHAHERSWLSLNRQYGNSPFLDPLFVKPLLVEFARGDEMLAIGRAGDHPVVMAIVQRTGVTNWKTFQPANNPLGALVLDPKFVSGSADFVESNLVSRLPGPAMILGLSQIDPDLLPRPPDTTRVRSLDYIETARITLTGSYDEFWAARGKNLRHNMNRQRNRLNRESVEVRLERLTGPEDMGQAVDDFANLESAGWKAAAASAVHQDNAQGRFYKSMLENFALDLQAAVFRFYYGDRLVASDLCLLRDSTLFILKTSYDETQKGTSPAHLMRHEVIKDAFRVGDVQTIEFYGPVQDWHRKWTGQYRTLYHLNLYRWTLISAVHARRTSEPA